MAVLASAGSAAALIKDCTGTAQDEGGNWFCGAVSHILYSGIQGQGSYQAVTQMTDSGECLREAKAYSGPLSPLDEDVGLSLPRNRERQVELTNKRTALPPLPWPYRARRGRRLLSCLL